jgi:hypothetical protein
MPTTRIYAAFNAIVAIAISSSWTLSFPQLDKISLPVLAKIFTPVNRRVMYDLEDGRKGGVNFQVGEGRVEFR